ncbi:flagellar hook-length control protein FliK [Acidithiobacillus sp.]
MAPEAMNSVAASPPSSPAANGGNGPSSTAAAEPFASVMGRQMSGAGAPAKPGTAAPETAAPPSASSGQASSKVTALTKKAVEKDAKGQPDGKTLPPTPTPVLPMLFADPGTVPPVTPSAGLGGALATEAVAVSNSSPSGAPPAALPRSPAFGQAQPALTTKGLQADAAHSSNAQGQTLQSPGRTPMGATAGPPSAALTELPSAPLLAAAAHGGREITTSGSGTPPLPDQSLLGVGAAPGGPNLLLSAPPLVTSAPVSTMAATLAPPVSTAPAWGNALGQQLLFFVGNNLQQATLHLNPPHLGPLEVHLDLQQGQANAFFISSHPVVREAIAAALPQLQAGFAAVGMQLGQATVTADGGGGAFPRGKSPQGRRPESIDEIGAAPVTARVQLGLVNTFA